MNAWEWVPAALEIQVFALHVALAGVFITALVLGIACLLRRRSEPARYGLLLAGVIGLLCVPALVGAGRAYRQAFPAAIETQGEVVRVPAERLTELLQRPAEDVPETRAEAAPVFELAGSGLLVLWVLGMAIGFRRLLWDFWKQRRVLVGPPWQASFWTETLRSKLAEKLGLSAFPPVRLSPAAPMPMVLGVWRPVIVLPEPAPASWQQPQWEAVLLHEAAHIARRDPWAVVAQRVAVILFWWCPLVHRLARRLNELRENICDDCAVQGSCDRMAYAELLVESAEQFLRARTPSVRVA